MCVQPPPSTSHTLLTYRLLLVSILIVTTQSSKRPTIIGEIRHGKHAHAVSTASLKIEQFSSNHNK